MNKQPKPRCTCQDKAAEGQPHIHHTPPPVEEKIIKSFREKFSLKHNGKSIETQFSVEQEQFISEVIKEVRQSERKEKEFIINKILSEAWKVTSVDEQTFGDRLMLSHGDLLSICNEVKDSLSNNQ